MAFLPILGTIAADVPLVLQLLNSLGIVKSMPSQTTTEIAAVVADLTAIAKAGKEPTGDQIAGVVKLLGDLKAGGIISGTVVDEAIASLDKFSQVSQAYVSGQVALLDSNFSFAGVHGDLIAISKGGPAAQLLGL